MAQDDLSPSFTRLCAATDVVNGGAGKRFTVIGPERTVLPAFVIRVNGQVQAFLNRCAHVSVEMDFPPGQFLDETGQYIVCQTHGAIYDAVTGLCLGGPCRNSRLTPIDVLESEGTIRVPTQIN